MLKYVVFPDTHLVYSALLIVTPFIICGVHSLFCDPTSSTPSLSIGNKVPSVSKKPGMIKEKFKLNDDVLIPNFSMKNVFLT